MRFNWGAALCGVTTVFVAAGGCSGGMPDVDGGGSGLDAARLDASDVDAARLDASDVDAARPDGGVSPLDASADGDVSPCGAGEKECAGICVPSTPENGCADPLCVPCAVPTGGVAACSTDDASCVSLCTSGSTACAGACVAVDPTNGCGASDCTPCAVANVTAPRCEAGGCGYVDCAPGFENRDGNRTNGCETPACAPSEKRCSDGRCVSMSSSDVGCGLLGSCDPCPTPVLPVETVGCAMDVDGVSQCAASTCALTYVLCNGECLDSFSPASGCGTCTPCSATLQHATGLGCWIGCFYTACESGWIDADGNVANGCETALTCSTGMRTCGGIATCNDSPFTGCGGPSCSPCALPAGSHGTSTCLRGPFPPRDFICSIACDTGYKRCGGAGATGRCVAGNPSSGCDLSGCTSCASRMTHVVGTRCIGAAGATVCDYTTCETGWRDRDGDRTNGCESATPLAVSPANLQLWLIADDGSFTDATDSWADQSGHGRVATGGGPRTFVPNEPWLPRPERRFIRNYDGSMHFFGVNEFREVFRGGWTVVAVVARGHNQDQNWILGGDFRFDPADGSEGSRPTCVAHGCLNIGFRNATTFALDTYTHAVETPVPAVPGRGCATTAECEANRQYFVVLARFDPTVGYSVSVLDRAGVESHASDGVTTGLPTGFGFANLRIFRGSQIASTASDFGQGGFGELLIYDTALSDADVGTIGTYLRAEWGL